MEISREADRVTQFQGVDREENVADQEFYQTQYGLLQARSLAERVATQLRLVDDPKFFELFDASTSNPAFELVNGRYAASGRAERQRVAGEVLLKHLGIAPARLSRLVDIRFTSPDPEFSAKVANSWAENFIQSNLERKIQATSYGRNLLQRQLAQFKEKLDESQRQLVAYASSQRIINLPAQSGDGRATSERSIVADDLASLNSALSQATAERIQAEARYQQAGKLGASTEALRNQAINNLRQRRAELASEYQRLMTQFTPGYPAAQALQSQISQLERSIAREEGRVSSSLLADYREASERELALQKKVEELKASYLDLYEYQGKQLFAQYGIPVSAGEAVREVDAAVAAADRVGYPVVVKAQVQVGGRGKAGGIKLADNADEVRLHAGNILGMDIKGHLVKRIWVEHASDIVEEYYASFTLDRAAKKHLLMLSAQGGVDIEEVAAKHPEMRLIHKPVNEGKGAAIRTAISSRPWAAAPAPPTGRRISATTRSSS